jgi:predicted secreted hydrolase
MTMKRFWIILLAVAVVAAGIFILPEQLRSSSGPVLQSQVLAAGSNESVQGFTLADGSRPLQLPQDQGPHPDFQTEWWYYTGNLEAPDGRHFGYQLTFFRRALLPPQLVIQRPSDWATNQVYMAHFALTDVAANSYHAFEHLSRGAVGLAGARSNPYSVWLDDWQVSQGPTNTYQLHAAQGGLALDLRLLDLKGFILQGDQGYSRKGPAPGQASYYYSQTRLQTQGIVTSGGKQYTVSGFSWMDHEFSTSALAKNQAGWDWFALQLDDQSELMVYQLRRADGSIDPFSSGSYIAQDGRVRLLALQDFHIQVENFWTSPQTKAKYPSRWTIQVPGENLTLNIEPYIPNQELHVSFVYWEGAVKFSGTHNGKPVSGSGYVELTGYATSLGGQF